MLKVAAWRLKPQRIVRPSRGPVESASPATRISWPAALALILGGTVTGLLVAEAGARVWVGTHWPKAQIFQYTHFTHTRGRYTEDSVLGYRLHPGYIDPTGTVSHNSIGFRGPPIASSKPPGTFRVAMIGASTVYGVAVSDSETGSVRLQQRLQAAASRPVEVVNAGVPGWTSWETLRNLQHRVLPLEPDVVIEMEGRNEIFPQLFNHYRDDYSHYRVPDYQFRFSNRWYKTLFRISHLAMFFMARGGGRMGFVRAKENPAYSSIIDANRPTEAEVRRNATDRTRLNGFDHNLRHMIGIERAHAITPILATIPFRANRFRSGVLPREDHLIPVIDSLVARDNDLVRRVARDSDVTLVEGSLLATTPGLLSDDCHFTAAGEQVFASMVYRAVEPLMVTWEARQLHGP